MVDGESGLPGPSTVEPPHWEAGEMRGKKKRSYANQRKPTMAISSLVPRPGMVHTTTEGLGTRLGHW